MIYLIGVFIAFFLALIILTKKGRNLADAIMGIWMVIIGLHLLSYYGFITGKIFQYPTLLGLNIPIPFFHGALLYLYVDALTQPNNFASKKWLIHGALPIFIISIHIPFYSLSNTEKIWVFRNEGYGYETVMTITSTLLSISGITYIFITNRILQQHKKRILNHFSNKEKINLKWVQFLTYAMCLMWVLIILIKNDEVIFSAASIFVVFIGYFGIKQVGIFTNQQADTETMPLMETITVEDTTEAIRKKYAKSGLNNTLVRDLHLRLRSMMATEKLYTEPELTLADLASKLAIHPNYLSQIINEMEGVNFYDYINTLRIEEFKRLVVLPQNQRFTLLALAFECGFNSKSTFNRFFKKTTDLSPSEYAKQVLQANKVSPYK